MKHRDVLDEVQCHWAAAGAIAALIGTAISTYSAARTASHQKKSRALQAAALGADSGGSAIGGYTPSASVLSDQVGDTLFNKIPDSESANRYLDAPEDQLSMGGYTPPPPPPETFEQKTEPPKETTITTTPKDPVPYDQYASLAQAAAQIAQMFQPQGPAGSSSIPQATMGPYSPTAAMFLQRRRPYAGGG